MVFSLYAMIREEGERYRREKAGSQCTCLWRETVQRCSRVVFVGASFSGQIKGLEWLSREFLTCVDGDEAGCVSLFFFSFEKPRGLFSYKLLSSLTNM
jgi:hypothetical protein